MKTDNNDKVLVRLLDQAYLEIIPAPGIVERLEHIPRQSYIAISCSPTRGVEPTLELMESLAGRDWKLVPHIAARTVRDTGHLREILARLDAARIESVFVPGGDAPRPAGEYESSLQLLQDMAEIGHQFEGVGIASHPEGHPVIDDTALLRLLLEKQKFASYLVTQMCFDPGALVEWLSGIRAAGVTLPAWIGLPGVAERAKLFKLSLRLGVGRSVKMLLERKDMLKKMLQLRPYQPDDLLYGLAPHLDNEALDIPGFHLFSFNAVERTERWRMETLAQYRAKIDKAEGMPAQAAEDKQAGSGRC